MLPKLNQPLLLEKALTHRSALNEPSSGTPSKVSNERLEFLGDAVLELAVTRFLFNQLPEEPEGKLTAYRSALVRTTTLAEVAAELDLGVKLYMSKGEEATGGRSNESLLADTMESVIGAVYLDQGFKAAEEFIAKHILPKFSEIKEKKLYKDAKSLLQELVQSQGYPTPKYKVVKEVGPDHAKIFTVEVAIGGKVEGQGLGASKQEAQQKAAREAIRKLEKN
jgi:ribonuclease III